MWFGEKKDWRSEVSFLWYFFSITKILGFSFVSLFLLSFFFNYCQRVLEVKKDSICILEKTIVRKKKFFICKAGLNIKQKVFFTYIEIVWDSISCQKGNLKKKFVHIAYIFQHLSLKIMLKMIFSSKLIATFWNHSLNFRSLH